MYKFRNILLILWCILFIVNLFYIDFSNLSWSNNKSSYIGIFVCILGIVSMVVGNKDEKQTIAYQSNKDE
jgi:uncharacterized membrane protein